MPHELQNQAQAALAAQRYPEALELFQRLLAQRPEDVTLRLALASIEMNLERPEQAVQYLAQATQLQPGFTEAWLRRGQVLMLLGKPDEALECFETTCRLDPRQARGWEGLVQVHKALQRDFAGLLRARRELVKLNPTSIDAWLRLGYTYRSGDLAEEATTAYQAVLQLKPDHLAARWTLFQNPPASCFADEQAIADFAARWHAGVAWFEALPLQRCDRAEIAQALLTATDYCLHYQPGALLHERTRYAALVTRLAHAVWQPPRIQKRARTGRRRIGFTSAFFRRHSVMKVAHGLIAALGAADFEVMIYHLDDREDAYTLELKNRVHGYRGGAHGPEHWLATIAQDAPDVLVHLDIGMNPLSQVLPAYRLAPVQIAFWGHPLTSGYAAIDWFVSADEVESQAAQEHYSERLYRLAGLGTCYAQPQTAEAPDARNDQEVRFLLAQNVLKIDPRMDEALARIATHAPHARFHVLPHLRTHVAEALRQRLQRAFARHGLDADTFIRMQTHCSETEFFALAGSCDLNLDTPHWSGGVSTFDLTAQDLPTLTCAGETFRSRQSMATLKRLGLDVLVTDSMEDYTSRAVALAHDRDQRALLRQQVSEHKHLLYEDRRVQEDWVRFLNSLEPVSES